MIYKCLHFEDYIHRKLQTSFLNFTIHMRPSKPRIRKSAAYSEMSINVSSGQKCKLNLDLYLFPLWLKQGAVTILLHASTTIFNESVTMTRSCITGKILIFKWSMIEVQSMLFCSEEWENILTKQFCKQKTENKTIYDFYVLHFKAEK